MEREREGERGRERARILQCSEQIISAVLAMSSLSKSPIDIITHITLILVLFPLYSHHDHFASLASPNHPFFYPPSHPQYIHHHHPLTPTKERQNREGSP